MVARTPNLNAHKHWGRQLLGGCTALLTLIALSGCGGGGGGSSDTSGTPGTPAPAQQASVTTADNFTFMVSEDKDNIAVGQSVTIKAVLVNNTGSPISGEFAGNNYYLPTLDPLLSLNTLVEDSSLHGINLDGSPASPYTVTMFVPVTLKPGQSLVSTRVYTFTRADTYTVNYVLQNHQIDGFTETKKLTITVH